MEDASQAALNARGLAATLHVPHHRLAGGRFQVWERPEDYTEDYTIEGVVARAGEGWARSDREFRRLAAAGPAKEHLDVQFTRRDRWQRHRQPPPAPGGRLPRRHPGVQTRSSFAS
jgi:hypothetical protein